MSVYCLEMQKRMPLQPYKQQWLALQLILGSTFKKVKRKAFKYIEAEVIFYYHFAEIDWIILIGSFI